MEERNLGGKQPRLGVGVLGPRVTGCGCWDMAGKPKLGRGEGKAVQGDERSP